MISKFVLTILSIPFSLTCLHLYMLLQATKNVELSGEPMDKDHKMCEELNWLFCGYAGNHRNRKSTAGGFDKMQVEHSLLLKSFIFTPTHNPSCEKALIQ